MGVDQSRWTFVATDMSGNTTTGGGQILNTANKQYAYNKNAGRTVQFDMDIANPRGNFIMNNDCLIKFYRRTKVSGVKQLMMVGDVIQAQEAASGDSGSITVVAADPYWRLQRRLLGMGVDTIGRGVGYQDGNVTSLQDNAAVLADIIINTNTIFPTGLGGVVTVVSATGFNTYIGPVYAQNVGDMVQQIFSTTGSPDFEIAPLEPSGVMPNTIIGHFNVYGAGLGQARPNCVWEYGTGKRNMSGYGRLKSKDGLCNQAFSPPQGFPDVGAAGDTMIVQQDSTSINAIGLYQDIVQSDVTSIGLRTVLAQEYVAVRKQARQQITLTPSVDNPQDYNVDYQVGDTVTARAYVNGQYRFNGSARVYGVSITLDQNDAETVAITLIPS